MRMTTIELAHAIQKRKAQMTKQHLLVLLRGRFPINMPLGNHSLPLPLLPYAEKQ